jgi:hypothetical protein
LDRSCNDYYLESSSDLCKCNSAGIAAAVFVSHPACSRQSLLFATLTLPHFPLPQINSIFHLHEQLVFAFVASVASVVVQIISPHVKSLVIRVAGACLSAVAVIGPVISLAAFADNCVTGTAGVAQILVIIALVLSVIGTAGQLALMISPRNNNNQSLLLA